MKRLAAASLLLLGGDTEYPWAYAGTRRNIDTLGPSAPYQDCTGLSGIVAVVGFPWSLALDTTLLPLTLPLQLFLGSPEKKISR